MGGMNDYTLHTGFKKEDLLKIFASRPIDGEFRTRQLSYLLEMVPFKIGQKLGIIDIRNFTLIAIHLANVLLLGLLVFHLTQNKLAGFLSGFMLLNSGIALMTLLFPFRNAKLLVMTFFLLSWLILASGRGKFCHTTPGRFTAFFLMFILAFFTDEYSVFLFLLFPVFLLIRDGKEGVFNARMLKGFLATAVVCALFTAASYRISQNIDPSISLAVYQRHLHKLGSYFLDSLRTIKELAYAFFSYFLPKNFGYWALSGWGLAAFIASLVVFLKILAGKHPPKTYLTVAAVFCVLLLKNLLLPHNNDSSYHPGVIPDGINFPSLLFFEYYYVYCEAVLVFLIAALLLSSRLTGERSFLFFLFLISIVNFSNFTHMKKLTAIENSDKTRTFPKIITAKLYLQSAQNSPVYLSFPSGNNDFLKRSLRDFDPSSYRAGLDTDFVEYATSVPTYYLRAIEEGRAIISLQNAKPKKSFSSLYELVNAESFFDIPRQEFFPLGTLKKHFGAEQFEPKNIAGEKKILINAQGSPDEKSLIFFIKGGAKVFLTAQENHLTYEQTYGQSYQIFKFRVDPVNFPSEIQVRIVPLGNQAVSFVGPFVLDGKI